MIHIAGNHQFFYSNLQIALVQLVAENILSEHKKKLKSLSIVLLNDESIRELNNETLNHDYYTDIITFDLSENKFHVETELYISFDRVKDNAQTYNTSNKKELLRVVLHGCLHIAGYGDKSEKEAKEMRQKEDLYINQYLILSKNDN